MGFIVPGPPDPSEYDPYYAGYVARCVPPDPVSELKRQGASIVARLSSLGEERSRFRYAPGKWSIQEVLGHVIDAERIFTCRALRISRNDRTPLPGFEQDDYIRFGPWERIPPSDVLREFTCVREASVLLFQGLDETAWNRRGTASGYEVTVRALAYITAGHAAHHLRVLEQKYGLGV